MKDYIIRRFFQILIVLLGVATIVFFVVYLTGDPARLMLPMDASQEAYENLRLRLRLDEPLYLQYGIYLGQILRGDFGVSFRHGEPSLQLTLSRFPATLELTFFAVAIASILAIPIGVHSALRRNSLTDNLSRVFALFGLSMPVFWSGLMLILLFSVFLGWLPPSGRGTWKHIIMPGFSLGLFATAPMMRLVRSSVLDILNMDYIRTARAKGLTERVVIYKHALRNAAIPVVTFFGMQFGLLLGGSVLTETIFSWPGMGRFIVQAIYNRDFPVVRTAIIIFAIVIVTVNFTTDLIYAFLNPKIRYE